MLGGGGASTICDVLSAWSIGIDWTRDAVDDPKEPPPVDEEVDSVFKDDEMVTHC